MYVLYVCRNSSACTILLWVELGHSHFSLGKSNVVELGASHFSKIITREMGDKNDFQRKLLSSDQFSDYGATKVSQHISLSKCHLLSFRSV